MSQSSLTASILGWFGFGDPQGKQLGSSSFQRHQFDNRNIRHGKHTGNKRSGNQSRNPRFSFVRSAGEGFGWFENRSSGELVKKPLSTTRALPVGYGARAKAV